MEGKRKRGFSLLETGLPPADNYACRVNLPGQPVNTYVVEYRKTEDLAYAVSVRPATPSDSILPEAPATFAVADDGHGNGNGNGNGNNGNGGGNGQGNNGNGNGNGGGDGSNGNGNGKDK